MRRICLRRVSLRYGGQLVLHTATSGAVAFLDELRLVVERDGRVEALGATRLNIAYLTGILPDALAARCLAVAPGLLDDRHPDLPASARMLFEMAAADGAAREAGVPLGVHLGGGPAARTPTNQTLFQADDDAMLARAQAYVARGFADLKLRVGFGDLDDDLRRLRLLRERLGPAVTLAADANGAWGGASAAQVRELAGLGLALLEQPLPAADWDGLARRRDAGVPVMLDESLCDMDAIARLAASRAAPLAHLKLAKLGGLDRMLRAGAMLRAAGIGVMVGQMNEGAVSTLAAAHAAVALGALHRELYGADGLLDDPAGPLRYAEGHLHLPPGSGLGLGRHAAAGTTLWEHHA